VGVIGLGEIGQVHAAGIRQSRTARLVAVADTAPELLPPFEAEGVQPPAAHLRHRHRPAESGLGMMR
jgi:predicted dehydrogenase